MAMVDLGPAWISEHPMDKNFAELAWSFGFVVGCGNSL